MRLTLSRLPNRGSVYLGMTGLLIGALLVAVVVWRVISHPKAPATFESAPRSISTGTNPSLVVRDTGDIYLLKADKGDLWFERSADGGDTFGHPIRVNDLAGEVVPHAEAEPRLFLRGGRPYAVWQAHAGGESDSTKLRFSRSIDYGESFTKAIDVDPAGLPASQSFFNMNVSPKGTVFVVWLDGREKGGAGGSAAVYLARSTDGGASFEKSVRVALNSCPCCRPSVAFTDENTVHVGFRKLFGNNVRDIAVATSKDGGKTFPEPVRVAEDNWQINGCPHSGPSLATLNGRLFVSWFTVHDKEEQSYVYLSHSDDGGHSFSDRQWLSEGAVDANHPYLVAANDRILATFQGRDPKANNGWGKVNVYLREVSKESRLSSLMTIGNHGASATNPILAFESPGHIFLAWGESGTAGPNVVLARGRLATNSVM